MHPTSGGGERGGSAATLRTSRKPAHRQPQQQRWNPRLTIRKSLPIFATVGILFVGVGSTILIILRHAQEVTVDYTWCASADNGNRTCADVIGKSTLKRCRCAVPFAVERDIVAPVFLYYGLTNFYQNHRKYVKSRDDRQLMGLLGGDVSPDCRPLDYVRRGDNVSVPIAPCGAIANSMFSDTLTVYAVDLATYVPLIRTGIAWPEVKRCKYRNPPGDDLRKAFENYSKPVAWNRNVWELDATDAANNGFENEDFIVWMQPATLSSFRKLYRRVNHTQPTTTTNYFNGTLPAGRYRLLVSYTYPVTVFGGTKSLIIANTTVLGGKNIFLGVAYIVTGSVCIIIAIILFGIRLRNEKLA